MCRPQGFKSLMGLGYGLPGGGGGKGLQDSDVGFRAPLAKVNNC